MLAWEWAVERLERARNYWVCTTQADGRPHAAPVWGVWHGDGVVFSTSPDSAKGRNLARDPRATVHLESGEDVVILEGEVAPVALDTEIAALYEAKYDFKLAGFENEAWYRLCPAAAYAWREQDFPRSATRFTPG
jgi:PPOX class probable F420-dependent enzyme